MVAIRAFFAALPDEREVEDDGERIARNQTILAERIINHHMQMRSDTKKVRCHLRLLAAIGIMAVLVTVICMIKTDKDFIDLSTLPFLLIPITQVFCAAIGLNGLTGRKAHLLVPVLVYAMFLYFVTFFAFFVFLYSSMTALYTHYIKEDIDTDSEMELPLSLLLMFLSAILSAWSAVIARSLWRIRRQISYMSTLVKTRNRFSTSNLIE